MSAKNPFSLLEIIGGECAGAISLYPEGAEPHDVHLRHWHRLVPDSATARKALQKSLSDMARKTLSHAAQLTADLKRDNATSPLIESILGIIKRRSARISSETKT